MFSANQYPIIASIYSCLYPKPFSTKSDPDPKPNSFSPKNPLAKIPHKPKVSLVSVCVLLIYFDVCSVAPHFLHLSLLFLFLIHSDVYILPPPSRAPATCDEANGWGWLDGGSGAGDCHGKYVTHAWPSTRRPFSCNSVYCSAVVVLF